MKTAALVLLLAAAPAAAEVRYATFSSPSLGKDVAYAVQLPPSYATAATRRYPDWPQYSIPTRSWPRCDRSPRQPI